MTEIPIPIMQHMLANSEAGRPQLEGITLDSSLCEFILDVEHLVHYIRSGHTIIIAPPKPRTTIIGGQELVCALTKAPEVGEAYWYIYADNKVFAKLWEADEFDLSVFEAANLFAEFEHAIAWVPVLAKIKRGELTWATK